MVRKQQRRAATRERVSSAERTPTKGPRRLLTALRRDLLAHESGKPRPLPLQLSLDDLGLSLAVLRSALRQPSTFGRPLPHNDPAKGKLGFSNPPLGRLIGTALAPRIGALLSRPGCAFDTSFLWQYHHGGDSGGLHVDRSPLDITMSIPVALHGADAWPLRVRPAVGAGEIAWPSQPGLALLFDGRWRPHWRAPFAGQCAVILLLHWRAPAVLWPQLFAAADRQRLLAGECGDAGVMEKITALSHMAVPQTTTPELQLVDLQARTRFPNDVDEGRRVVVLAPLEDALTLTFERTEMAVSPGDGVAFATHDPCRLGWSNGSATGRVLIGSAPARIVVNGREFDAGAKGRWLIDKPTRARG